MSDNNPQVNAPPVRRDKEIEMKKMEIETVNRVISDPDLKTQFSQPERILITLLDEIARKPFSISEKIATERGILFAMKRYEYPLLSELIRGYSRKGKALDRKGIGEDVDIVRAYFTAQIEQAKASERKQNPLMK
jgi:hypothetical protein